MPRRQFCLCCFVIMDAQMFYPSYLWIYVYMRPNYIKDSHSPTKFITICVLFYWKISIRIVCKTCLHQFWDICWVYNGNICNNIHTIFKIFVCMWCDVCSIYILEQTPFENHGKRKHTRFIIICTLWTLSVMSAIICTSSKETN